MILSSCLGRDSVTFAVSVTPKAAKDRIRNLSEVASGGPAPKLVRTAGIPAVRGYRLKLGLKQ